MSLVALIASVSANAALLDLGSLTWMKAYVGQRVWTMHEDKRFKRDVYRVFASPTVPWMSGRDGKSLAAGIYSGATGGYLSYGGDQVRNTPAGGIEADGSLRGVVESDKWLCWSNAAATDGIIVFVELERGSNSHGDEHVDSSASRLQRGIDGMAGQTDRPWRQGDADDHLHRQRQTMRPQPATRKTWESDVVTTSRETENPDLRP